MTLLLYVLYRNILHVLTLCTYVIELLAIKVCMWKRVVLCGPTIRQYKMTLLTKYLSSSPIACTVTAWFIDGTDNDSYSSMVPTAPAQWAICLYDDSSDNSCIIGKTLVWRLLSFIWLCSISVSQTNLGHYGTFLTNLNWRWIGWFIVCCQLVSATKNDTSFAVWSRNLWQTGISSTISYLCGWRPTV